jgi:uronate dehydrogenase
MRLRALWRVINVPRVLITGAAGIIGGFLRRGLPQEGWQLRLLDIAEIPDPAPTEQILTGDIRDTGLLGTAVKDVDAVVHLAGISGEDDFDRIRDINIDGTYQVFEACRRAGPRRIVYASSNHAVGFTPRSDLATVDVPVSPDTYYGLSKAFGEAAARLYVNKYGMEIACLRIGSCFDRPRNVRMLSTWLSPGDIARLVHACLTAPGLRFATVYGTSANTRGWWDLGPARALGYQPRDDAEVFAEEMLAAHGELDEDDPDYRYLGGRFTEMLPPGQSGG